MNDVIVEKLIQKVINLTEEVNDVNILVRRLSPPQEIVNKIHERLDAIHTAIGIIEKRLESDDRRLVELHQQDKLLKEEADKREKNLDLRLKALETSLSKVGGDLWTAKKETEMTISSVKESLLERIGDHKLGLLVAGVMVVVLIGVFLFK